MPQMNMLKEISLVTFLSLSLYQGLERKPACPVTLIEGLEKPSYVIYLASSLGNSKGKHVMGNSCEAQVRTEPFLIF